MALTGNLVAYLANKTSSFFKKMVKKRVVNYFSLVQKVFLFPTFWLHIYETNVEIHAKTQFPFPQTGFPGIYEASITAAYRALSNKTEKYPFDRTIFREFLSVFSIGRGKLWAD